MLNIANDRVTVDADLRESIEHGSHQFPLKIYTNRFKTFINFLIGWHWHPHIEFNLVRRGRVEVCVSNKSYVLQTGEGMFINANAMHMMRPVKDEPDTEVSSLVFSPAILESDPDSDIYRKYVQPVLECEALPALFLAPDLPWQYHLLDCLAQACCLYAEKLPGYEMRMRNLISDGWLGLSMNMRGFIEEARKNAAPAPGLTQAEHRAHSMIAYIQTHFAENITVEDIAAAANVSRSECFRTFQASIHQKPIEYLIECRISNAQRLLRESSLSVTEIASACGFNHSSYFCRLFKEKCGISPKNYRAEKLRSPLERDIIGDTQ